MIGDVVRTSEEGAGLDREPLLILDPLAEFLDRHDLGRGALDVAPIGDGHSNVTYALRRDGLDAVLRRPPRGPLPPSAHDVLREVRVLEAMKGQVPVPTVLAACADPAVIGAPFYVMERVAGHVVENEVPAELSDPADLREVARRLVETLVEIHAVDWRAVGLGDLGRTDGYLDRQLRRFGSLWVRNRTRDLPVVERVADLLTVSLPPSSDATVVHGDFRLGNVIISEEHPPRVSAVLDWEMATIGDPLADLGYLSALWTEAGDPRSGAFGLVTVTRAEGFPSREELVGLYAELSGRDVARIDWYQAFALWKASVFMEGNLRRVDSGADDDPFVAGFAPAVPELAERAEELLRRK